LKTEIKSIYLYKFKTEKMKDTLNNEVEDFNNEMDEFFQAAAEAEAKDEKSGGKDYLTKEEKRAKEFKIKTKDTNVRFLTFDPVREKTKNKFFATAFFHDIQIGEYKQKIYCNKNDDKPCPLCKKSESILAKQKKAGKDAPQETKDYNKSIYKNAMAWASREYTILKLVEPDSIKDKIKFWRTTKPIEGTSTFQKMADAVKSLVGEFPSAKYYDLRNGYNFTVNAAQKSLNTNKTVKYWEVSSILPKMKATAVSNDDDTILAIENDKTVWQDIFNKFEIKDVITFDQFLELCAEGNGPYWNKDLKTFVFPNHPELKEKYEKVLLERRSSMNEDGDYEEEEDEVAGLERAEKFAKDSLSTKSTIEDMDDDDDDDYDDDELPF